MRTSLIVLWGCARGPVSRLSPPTRLLVGSGVFAVGLVVPAATWQGTLLALSVVGSWLAFCRPPLRAVRLTIALGLILFLPYFALMPLLPVGSRTESWRAAVAVPWAILVHGLCGMLASMATVASLTAGELRAAMVRLPIPRTITALLLQIVHQTATLFHETRRMAAAMAVRGASGRGAARLRLLAALPQVWLPRVVDRAERVSMAMELRGFCDRDSRSLQDWEAGGDCHAVATPPAGRLAAFVLAPVPLRPSGASAGPWRFRFADWAALTLALGALAVALSLRLWSTE